MLREKSHILTNVHKTLDIILVIVAFISAYYIKKHLLTGLATWPNYYFILILAIGCLYLSFHSFYLYDPFRTQRFHTIFFKIIKSVTTGILGLIFCLYLAHYQDISRLLILTFTLLLILLLTASKALIYFTLVHHRKREFNTRNVLIIGCGEMAIEMIKAIKKNPASGYKILGCIKTSEQHDHSNKGNIVYDDVSIIGTMADFTSIIVKNTVDEIVFAELLGKINNISEYIHFAEKLGINIRIMPDFQIQRIMYRPETARVYMNQFVGIPTIALSSAPGQETAMIFKSFIDYLVAGLGVIILSPLFIIIAISIKITSPGPVFFSQIRSGLNGRKFTMYKFRTMIEGAEAKLVELNKHNEMDGPVFKMANDPRITPIGKFLRKTSLDELPQLFNILKGEMSIVGPRPPIPAEVEKYKSWERRRLSMKPGLTCIWQVSGRNSINFDEWMRLDLEYIDNWSPWLDTKLLAKTIYEVLSFHGR